MPPTRVHRPGRILVAGLVAAMLVLIPAAQAHAGPTVAQIEAQINQVWAQAEPLIEKYDAIHEQYLKNKAEQAALQRRIQPLLVQLQLAQVRVGAIAAQAYKGGRVDGLLALLSGAAPDTLADQLSYADQLARDQERMVKGAADLKAAYDTQKAPLDVLVASLAQQDSDLAAQRKVIEDKLAQLQKLRIQAYGTSGATGAYRPWPCPSEYLPTKGYKAAAFACKQAGKPYIWDDAGPDGYDCSGLTLAAWKQVGVYLPHNAAAQRRSMPYVSAANLQIGDLVFFYSDLHHVAIYVGNGKIMTAPTFGDHVRMRELSGSGPIHSYGRPG